MGRKFDVEYSDFSGGHFVGAYDVAQPMNTYTGVNVAVTADQGFLMPDNGWAASSPLRTGTLLTGVSQPFIDGGDSNVVVTTSTAGVTTEELHLVSSTGGSFSTFAKGSSTNRFNAGNRVIQVADSAGNLRYASMKDGRIVLMAANGTVASDTATGFTQATGLWQWGVFTVSIGATNRNRVYFSDPGNPTSWTSTNFFDVGPSWASILAVVPTADVLYIASSEGWYAVSGILGQNNVVRKVATTSLSGNDLPVGVSMAPSPPLATASQFGVSFMAATRGIRVLRGSNVADAARPFGTTIWQIVAVGDVLAAYGSSKGGAQDEVWLWSEARRMWRASTLPSASSLGYSSLFRHQLVRDEANRSTHVNVVVSAGSYGSAESVLVLRQAKEQTNPAASGGVFPSATLGLADYQAKAPFRVTEVVVEVDFGTTSGDAARSLTAQVHTSALTDQDVTLRRTTSGDPQLPVSSPLTKTWSTLSSTTAGDREMVRFKVNDAAPAMAAAPRLTLQGVKVRRVIMRCEDL